MTKRLPALALFATLALAACSTGTATSAPSPLAPVPPAVAETVAPAATPSPAATLTSAAPKPNARGNIPKKIGEIGAIVPEGATEPTVTLKVTNIEVDVKCTEKYAGKPKNGHFVAVTLDVTTAASLKEAGGSFYTGGWKVIGPDGTLENDSYAFETCLPSKEMIPPTLGPGQRAVGKVLLDTQHTKGALVLSQPFLDGGWEWSY